MHIRTLTLENWGPYYGVHTLELTDTVYAVQAEHESDPDRSNWIGKSWFLGAIRFLLTGEKPASCPNEDGWISRGQDSGAIRGEFSDGTVVSRSRKRGSSTQLELKARGAKGAAKQEQAQVALTRLIGMSDEDLAATSFIEQRQIARLVLADPAERTRIVNGWMELEPLQRAEDWLKAQLNKWLDEHRRLPGAAPEVDVEALGRVIDESDETIAVAKAERSAIVDEVTRLATWRQHSERNARFNAVREQGRTLKAELDAIKLKPLAQLRERQNAAMLAKAEARDREHQLRELVDDQWDGKCPKTCEVCPVQSEVRAIGVSMQIELTEAESVLDDADATYQDATGKVTAADRETSEHTRKTVLIERLRVEALALVPSSDFIDEHGEPPTDADVRARLSDIDQRLAVAERAQAQAGEALKAYEAAAEAAEAAHKRRTWLDRAIRLHQEAIAVVGRQGAQREVAESVLAQVETGANRLLQAAGIDLAVEVSWAREGKGLATHCDACGASYPKAQSQKTCAVCGAQRGPKMVEKLLILPSDRSGAADDIAGLAFQLAASAWLRAKRSAPWAVVCIDEPFGQLDRANTRSLSAHLHSLIRNSYAFEQGFLVAHDASVMEALPSRVQIRGTSTGSTVRVIE